MLKNICARDVLSKSQELLNDSFKGYLKEDAVYDSELIGIKGESILAIGSFEYKVPALKQLYKNRKLSVFFDALSSKVSHLFSFEADGKELKYFTCKDNNVTEESIDEEIKAHILTICKY